MSSKNPLVPTTENMFNEGINYMEKKLNVVEKYITNHKGKNRIDAINKTDKPQEYQSKKYEFIRNESNKGILLDKSRSLDK